MTELTGLPTELTVSIKTDDATFKKKFLLYEAYHLDSTDPVIIQCIAECMAELKKDYKHEDLEIKVRAVLQI